MSERANFQKGYLWRYLLMAVLGIGFALYCAYDGFVAYPKRIPPAEAWAKIEGDEGSAEHQKAWEKIATENNWPLKKPDTVEHVQDSIKQQYAMGILALMVGIPATWLLITNRNSWVEPTENGLTTSWGQSVDFSSVVSLNKRKWKDKGIATARYRTPKGESKFVFDDFKYDREALGKILRRLESQLKDDQILEGEREPEEVPELAQ